VVEHVAPEERIEDLEAAHAKRHGSPRASSSCTSMRTAGSSPAVPERCPRRPRASGRQPWSSPNEISPGPISTRSPSMVTTYQRPESGTIHCGFGFSCHSPTQPTGSTLRFTVATPRCTSSCHCGAAPGIAFIVKRSRWQRFWWLTPFASTHTCQYGMRGLMSMGFDRVGTARGEGMREHVRERCGMRAQHHEEEPTRQPQVLEEVPEMRAARARVVGPEIRIFPEGVVEERGHHAEEREHRRGKAIVPVEDDAEWVDGLDDDGARQQRGTAGHEARARLLERGLPVHHLVERAEREQHDEEEPRSER